MEAAKFIETINAAGLRMAAAMKPAISAANKAIVRLGNGIYKIAESEYLQEHTRLPGSMKTKRLRLKRRTKVLDWFFAKYQTAGAK